MPSYVALLRGINVGGRKTVSMAALRTALADAGLSDVRTLLNSGNVVFSSTRRSTTTLATDIEKTISSELGQSVRALVLTKAELAAAIRANPLAELVDNPSRYHVIFLFDRLTAVAKAAALELDPDRVATTPRVVYHWCPDGFSHAPDLKGMLERKHDLPVTGRNWNTVTKLAELLS